MKKSIAAIFAIFLLSACSLSDGPSGNGDSSLSSAEKATLYHGIGSVNAPVLIEEFSDLECPACAQISPQVEKIVRANPDMYQMLYYHFPLPQHKSAFGAAEASECAADQGKFWEFVDMAFKNQKDLSKDNLLSFADTLKLNATSFKTCVENRDKKGKVNAELKQGLSRRVNSTPSFFVNGQLVRFTTAEAFEGYLKALAASAPASTQE